VIAIGDAAAEVAAVFAATHATVEQASSMAAAVELADQRAGSGDVVLLSPACTSFDAYANYGERGDHFTQLVNSRFS
jgi:UDP-N-acetylmuramoylalanine--D-glutamate ligase